MNDSCRASYNCGGQVAFVFRLPAGQVEFSGLFLTLKNIASFKKWESQHQKMGVQNCKSSVSESSAISVDVS